MAYWYAHDFTTAAANNAAISFSRGGTVATGDVEIAVLSGRSATASWSAPAGQGWTLVRSYSSTVAGGVVYVFERRYTAGDPNATFSYVGGGSNQTTIGILFAVSGVAAGTSIADYIGLEGFVEQANMAAPYYGALPGASTDVAYLFLAWANNDSVVDSSLHSTIGTPFSNVQRAAVSSALGSDAGLTAAFGSNNAAAPSPYAVLSLSDSTSEVIAAYLRFRNVEITLAPNAAALDAISSAALKTSPLGDLGDAIPARVSASSDPLGALFSTAGTTWPTQVSTMAMTNSLVDSPPSGAPVSVDFYLPSGTQADDFLMLTVVCQTLASTVGGYRSPISVDAGATLYGQAQSPNGYVLSVIYTVRVTAAMVAAGKIVVNFGACAVANQLNGGILGVWRGVNWASISGSAHYSGALAYATNTTRTVYYPGAQTLPTLCLDTDFSTIVYSNGCAGYYDRDQINFPLVGSFAWRAYQTPARSGNVLACTYSYITTRAQTFALPAQVTAISPLTSERRTFCRASSSGALYDFDPVMLAEPAYATASGPEFIELISEGEGVALEGSSLCVATASSPALVIPVIEAFLYGLVSQWRLVVAEARRLGIRVYATSDGVGWPMETLTLRYSSAGKSSVYAVGPRGSAPAVGETLEVTVRQEYASGTRDVAAFSGIVSRVRTTGSVAIVEADGAFSLDASDVVSASAVIVDFAERMRVAPDFYARPLDLLPDGRRIAAVTTSLRAGGQWFTEYDLG